MTASLPSQLLAELGAGNHSGPPPRTLVVVAHPDDEVIGAGSRLEWLSGATFVHVTDGSPRDLHDACAAGFACREDYASARRRELAAALSLVKVTDAQLISLEFPDRETAFNLVAIVHTLKDLIGKLKPALVLTHPYEGGHPDHDSISFAVHAACEFEPAVPVMLEMAFYHQNEGQLITGEFLPHATESLSITLTEDEWQLKQRMLNCFASQSFLKHFRYRHERFRIAPAYHFSEAPHAGSLFYENLDWNFTGREWRSLAQQAVAELDLSIPFNHSHQSACSKQPC